MSSSEICQRPFSEIEIDTNGDVHTCCPSYLKNYPIGNIFKVNSFDEIWYGDKAVNFRKKLLNNNYELCHTEICNKKINQEDIELCEKPDYPTLVRFAYDTQCNLKCMLCRDSIICNSEDAVKKYDDMIETILMPILKNAKILSLTSSGEVTASAHSQKVLKRAAELYPNLKFEILTNALLFNEEFCNKLGIIDKIDRIVISMHAMTKNTYETIMRGSNFETVMKNLEFIIDLYKQKKLNEVSVVFVASSLNYKEIPMFVEFCHKNNINPVIWEYRKFGNTEMGQKFSQYAVWEKNHPDYNDFVKILKKVDELYKDYPRLPQLFKDLEPVSKFEEFKNKLKFCFNKSV